MNYGNITKYHKIGIFLNNKTKKFHILSQLIQFAKEVFKLKYEYNIDKKYLEHSILYKLK